MAGEPLNVYTLAASTTELFTVEANSNYAVLSATLNNNNAGSTTRTVNIWVATDGGSAADTNKIVTAFSVQKGRQPSCALQGKTLAPGTKVYASADVASEVTLAVSVAKQPAS